MIENILVYACMAGMMCLIYKIASAVKKKGRALMGQSDGPMQFVPENSRIFKSELTTEKKALQLLQSWGADKNAAQKVMDFYTDNIYECNAQEGIHFLIVGYLAGEDDSVKLLLKKTDKEVRTDQRIITLTQAKSMIGGSVVLHTNVEGITWLTDGIEDERVLYIAKFGKESN